MCYGKSVHFGYGCCVSYFLKVPYIRYVFGYMCVLWKSTMHPVVWLVCFKSTIHLVLQVNLFHIYAALASHIYVFLPSTCLFLSGAGHMSAISLTMVSKDVRKDWNNHFIAFIPFLCGLTLELSHHLSGITHGKSSRHT